MRLKIVAVDEDGFNGRTHPPERSDVGLVVTAVAMERLHFHPETGEETHLADEGAEDRLGKVRDVENSITFWTVVTDDGRPLELVQHEVEPAALDEVLYVQLAHEYAPLVHDLAAALREALA